MRLPATLTGFFLVFFSLSRWIPGWCLQTGHDCLLPNS